MIIYPKIISDCSVKTPKWLVKLILLTLLFEHNN